METNTSPIDEVTQDQITDVTFFGQGATYFGIVAINVILTLLTLGLYYPWAKAAYRKYIWNEVEFKGSRFVFNGTGREMFKGFFIGYLILISFFACVGLLATLTYGWVAIIVFYLLLLILIPFALFGAWKYRVSRTSWRGIFFSFDGNFKEFLPLYLGAAFLTVITLGIYGSWMRVKITKYLFSHTIIGNMRMDFHGNGGQLFGINFLGIFLSIITIYLYIPVWVKDRFNFTVDNTSLDDGKEQIRFHSHLTAGEAWPTLFINGLLLIFTAGLAFPWTFIRTMRMFFNNVELPVEFDYDNLPQTAKDFRDATGDEMSDILDIGLDF